MESTNITHFVVNPNIDELKDIIPSEDERVFLNCPCTLIYGMTTSGKSSLLMNLLFKILLARYDISNVHIFS